MLTHRTEKRVRYGETDQMGYLYYGNYALYYEIGRAELLRSLGLTYREMEEEWGVRMPVLNLHCRFVRPARYDEVIAIITELRALPGREIVFHHTLRNAAGALVNGGRVALCFLAGDDQTRGSCPPSLTALLAPHFA